MKAIDMTSIRQSAPAWPPLRSAAGRRDQAALPGQALADSRQAGEVRAVIGQLTQELVLTPAEPDLARYLGACIDDQLAVQLAAMAFRLSSPLPGQPGGSSLAAVLGDEDRRSTTCSAGRPSPRTG